MGTTAQKLEYLGTTKSQLKTMISYGYPLTNETFREYVGGVFKALINSMSDTLNPTWNNLPKITTTPSTSLSINNTIEAPMRIELGASELSQSGTPTPSSPQDIHTISGSNTIKVEGSNIFDIKSFITSRGGTYTENTDGSITLTTNYGALYSNPYVFSDTNINVSLSGIIDNGTATNIRVQLINSNNEIVGEITSSSSSVLNKSACKLRFNWSTSGTFTLKNIMLNKGTTALPYTPYVSQEADIDLGVENYLPTSLAKMISANTGGTWVGNEYTQNNLKIKVNDDLSVVVNGTASAQTTFLISNNETLKAGTYVLNGIDGGDIARIYMWDSSWGNITNTTNSVEFTISEDKSIKVGVNLFNGKTFNNFKIEPMVSKNGGTYTPYGTTPIQYGKIGNYEDKFIRNSGKNLFNPTIQVGTYNDAVYSVNNGLITQSASDNSGWNISADRVFYLDKGTYTIKIYGTFDILQLRNLTDDIDIVKERISSKTFTLDSTKALAIKTYGTGVTYPVSYYIQLEKGSTTTDYEPYGSNEWYIKKNIGKVILDGSESYEIYDSGAYATNPYFKTTISIDHALTNDIICNQLKGDNITSTTSAIIQGTSPKIFLQPSNGILTTTDWQTHLSSNNLIFYIPLANPEYLPITGTLAEQLEAIYNAMSKNGQTNISQVNNDLAFNLNVSAIEEI